MALIAHMKLHIDWILELPAFVVIVKDAHLLLVDLVRLIFEQSFSVDTVLLFKDEEPIVLLHVLLIVFERVGDHIRKETHSVILCRVSSFNLILRDLFKGAFSCFRTILLTFLCGQMLVVGCLVGEFLTTRGAIEGLGDCRGHLFP